MTYLGARIKKNRAKILLPLLYLYHTSTTWKLTKLPTPTSTTWKMNSIILFQLHQAGKYIFSKQKIFWHIWGLESRKIGQNYFYLYYTSTTWKMNKIISFQLPKAGKYFSMKQKIFWHIWGLESRKIRQKYFYLYYTSTIPLPHKNWIKSYCFNSIRLENIFLWNKKYFDKSGGSNQEKLGKNISTSTIPLRYLYHLKIK